MWLSASNERGKKDGRKEDEDGDSTNCFSREDY